MSKPERARISGPEYATLNPGRFYVTKWDRGRYPDTWDVWRGLECLEEFATHAEAIAYAQAEARLTCTSCGRRMPYLEACIDGRPFCHPEEGRDCYAETSRKLALELGSYGIPQKFMIGAKP